MLVEATQITKMWTPLAGLQPIDLTVASGEMVAVRGRSGTGKSTLLALLAGFCKADAGRMLIDGQPPKPNEPWSRTSLVPQVFALARELTIRENVADVLQGSRDESDIDQLLTGLDLSDIAHRFTDHVSAGQQQRAAVARALIATPILLLADEPTSAQGAEHTAMVIDQLRRRAQRGSAVIVATHDPDVWAAADRTVDIERTPTDSSRSDRSDQPTGG